MLLAVGLALPAGASHAAPTGVTVTAGASQLTVGWTASTDAEGYRVQWKSGTQSWDTNRQTTISDGTTETATITSLTPATVYTVRVGSTKGTEDPAWSDTATGAPLFGCKDSTAVGGESPVAGANNDLIDDCENLLASKATLVGTSTRLNWSVSVSMIPSYSWTGVVLSSGNAPRVTRLVGLDNKQLSGSLPAALGNVSELTQISMPSNKLTGTIPAGGTSSNPTGLAKLSKLKSLDVSGNKLTGGIPAALGELSELTSLKASNNQLTGTIPAGGTSANPTGLAKLSKLKSLFFSNNKLTGSIPTALGELSDLQYISFAKNDLTGGIPTELGSLAELVYIYLHDNQLTGSIPTTLGNLDKLQHLYLYENQLSGAIPTELGNMSKLELLLLEENQLTGAIPTQLGNLPKLRTLSLYDNQLSGAIPSELGSLSTLARLQLQNNDLTGAIPSQLGNLTKVWYLNLSDNQLSGAIPVELGNMTKLEWLLLGENDLTGAIPSELGNASALTDLFLHNNQLTGTIPAGGTSSNPTGLARLSDLMYLRLDGNQLTGTIPAGGTASNPTGLARLSKLRWLLLSNNNLRGGIPSALGELSNLQYVYLDTNQLSGNIPTALGDLTAVVFLYLHENNLSGTIPAELGDMTALSRLYLHENQLTGAIPAGGTASNPTGLAKLTSLQQLYLNCNDLTGTIPNALGLITALTHLGHNGNSSLSSDLPSSLQARTDVTYPTVTCTSPGMVAPDPTPTPAPARSSASAPAPQPRLAAALARGPNPVTVGATASLTLIVTNTGQIPLTGVFWRSTDLGVGRRAIGDGTLAVGATVEANVGFGPVTAEQLPGPVVVTVFADSDQTDDVPATVSVAVQPAPAPDPRPIFSTLDLTIVRAWYSAPDPPEPHLGHNILDLMLALADGATVECFFLTHYETTGGLTRWGYAISEILEERPGALTQYYQRGAVDCHFRDGRWRMERRLTWDFIGGGLHGAPDLGVEPGLLSDQPGELHGPWGHRVSNFAVDGTEIGFLDFFEALGGVRAFGYPKTDARRDDHPDAVLRLPGATPGFIRQYFQAAVFEYHPDSPDAPVKLGLAGDLLRDLLYPDEAYLAFRSFQPAPPLDPGQPYEAERVIWSDDG